ncbi:MAG: exodeoxyribonuclease VII large subunit [Chloroflexi bacterium]|nr:MAG: exodeoxyribonuclease VII large subunit [Chloroflexota bacterium]MBL1196806.1 exodeoxyribonuclease VII large subunit [Chloroflexota bacterium]NOH14101.1 exodeoxyribonuclease VII large subunit [Chloroflexota bacterium]
MEQLTFFESQQLPLTVAEITRHVRTLLEGDEVLQDVWVQGEVSNLSKPKSGHLYFTLKDAEAALQCVMWRNTVQRQFTLPEEGDAVEVHGSVSVYEAGGRYQLYADQIRPAGRGALYQEFIELKERLEAEGLFDEELKRPIPKWPHRIGIITSPTGAALRDMLNTLRRRFPLAEVILAPAAVQGDASPGELLDALLRLNTEVQTDVIIIGRGGGSIEDLWAFNNEKLVRAIRNSAAPVISGVGHETDFTIADFVADLRAPTPTAAAEIATPDLQEIIAGLFSHKVGLEQVMVERLSDFRADFDLLQGRLERRSPESRIRSDRQRVDELVRRLESSMAHRTELQRARLTGLEQQLLALNPQAVLARGFAVVSKSDGKLVRSQDDVAAGDKLRVQVSDGEFGAEVTDK